MNQAQKRNGEWVEIEMYTGGWREKNTGRLVCGVLGTGLNDEYIKAEIIV